MGHGSEQPATAGRALRLEAGLGHVVLAGLEGDERAEVVQAWSRCAPTTEPAGSATVPDARRAPDGTGSWKGFHEQLVHTATTAAIEAGRGTHLMFHAACLADPDSGAGVVLAAASGTGKTTATRTLGRHYAYLTDETAIIAPEDLTITPFPKPLSLLGADGRRPKRQAGPDELGLGPTRGATLRCIAVLDRVREPEGDVTARSEPMPLADALTELVPQTSSLSRLPRGLVTLCRTLDRLGGARRLVYAEAADLRPVVDELLAAEPVPQAPTWEALEEAELAASSERAELAEGGEPAEGGAPEGPVRLRRRAADCGVHLEDGRVALLVDQQLIVLGGLGPSLWLLLDEPRTAEELLAALTAEGDAPADARALLDEAVRALRAEGVLKIQ
ncbi:PqqD family peptide modification chaperone [Micrococcus luteus]|uniref:PqqD family peptide modification chaperone n=1 Tax=Micrococcus luteus TaxID=1270 RepID=UPI0029DC337E|nr:PqqD family peptide modification chaperone [Micrococcus luteus]